MGHGIGANHVQRHRDADAHIAAAGATGKRRCGLGHVVRTVGRAQRHIAAVGVQRCAAADLRPAGGVGQVQGQRCRNAHLAGACA